jgi:hypothetical protein
MSAGAWWLAGAGLALALAGWLQWLGRDWTGPAGFSVWDNGVGGRGNSQSLLDPYSLLHLSFGIILCSVMRAYRLAWPVAMQACTVFAGLVAWEAIENVPAVIALFHPPAGASSYGGDSLLNVSGDLLAGMVGCAVSAGWSGRQVVAALVTFELATAALIGDGLLIGSLRMAGVA